MCVHACVCVCAHIQVHKRKIGSINRNIKMPVLYTDRNNYSREGHEGYLESGDSQLTKGLRKTYFKICVGIGITHFEHFIISDMK